MSENLKDSNINENQVESMLYFILFFLFHL